MKKRNKNEEEFKDIVSKIKDKLGSEVKDVKITSRLDSFASCITKDAEGRSNDCYGSYVLETMDKKHRNQLF